MDGILIVSLSLIVLCLMATLLGGCCASCGKIMSLFPPLHCLLLGRPTAGVGDDDVSSSSSSARFVASAITTPTMTTPAIQFKCA